MNRHVLLQSTSERRRILKKSMQDAEGVNRFFSLQKKLFLPSIKVIQNFLTRMLLQDASAHYENAG